MTNGSSLSGLLDFYLSLFICHLPFATCHLSENRCQAAKNFHVSSTEASRFSVRLRVLRVSVVNKVLDTSMDVNCTAFPADV